MSHLFIVLRSLRRRPGFVAVAVATLALGIGATTAIFGIVHAVLLEPLPFADPGRLVVVREESEREGRLDDLSALNIRDFKENQSLASLSVWREWGFSLTGQGEPRELDAVRVSADFFATLGVQPAIGRSFVPEDEQPGREHVAVLSDGFWRETFAADSGILNRSLVLDGRAYLVVGVMPPGFRFPDRQSIAVWVPLVFVPHEETLRGQRMFSALGRLRDGTDRERAESELQAIAARLARAYPETNGGWSVRLSDAREVFVGSQRPLIILLAAVSLVLAIACVNLVNLLLVRGADRRKEIAVRIALGAGRGRVIRHLATESLLLGLAGGAAGLALALGGMRLFVALDPGVIPRWNEVTLDVPVLLFAAVAAIGSSLVAALLPARQVLTSDVATSLKASGAMSSGPARSLVRQVLVVSEVALAFILVSGAGLLIHSLYRLQRVNPGFQSKELVVSNIGLASSRYPDDEDQHRFFRQLVDGLEGHPDIAAAAIVTTLPMHPVGIDHDMGYRVAGTAPLAAGLEPQADFRIASAGYFRLMGIPLKAGRDFTPSDHADAPPVMVVNETLARLAFPDGRVLGRKMTTGGYEFEVIGVAADIRHKSLEVAPRPEMFVHEPQIYSYGNMAVVARGRGDFARTATAIKTVVHRLDANQPVGTITTLPELLHDSISRRRFNLLLLALFAAVGLALSAIGIYGVIAYSVGQRTREIGIRSALGASQAALMGLVLGSGLRLALLGVGVGMVGAAGLTRLLQSQLYELSPLDPISFGGTGVLVALVALLASWIPARRTLRVSPLIALRSE